MSPTPANGLDTDRVALLGEIGLAIAPVERDTGGMADTDMTIDEREAFLADVHVGVLAIERDGKGPLAVPIWYQYDGTDVTVFMDGNSAKAKLLRRAGRATLTAQDETPPYRYVSVEGPVTLEPRTEATADMAIRYLGPTIGKMYADENPPDADSVTARLTPERWLTVDYGKSTG